MRKNGLENRQVCFSMNIRRISEALAGRPSPVITVAGDYCLDEYFHIDASLDEPSVETGLTAWQVREIRRYAGVGGTIAANLASLGASVRAVGIYGGDGEGFELIQALKRLGVSTDGMTLLEDRHTNTYLKPMREVDGIWTELNRLDIRNREPVPESAAAETIRQLFAAAETSDAVIISDQFTLEAGSVVTEKFREAVSSLGEKFPELFILADSRSFIEKYRNVTVKCNASELLKAVRRLQGNAAGNLIGADDEAEYQTERLETAARYLARRNGKPVVVTLGENGAMTTDGETITRVPAQRVEPPIDICGAGDATNAGLAFGTAIGLSLTEAAYLAGVISSITIKQLGVTGTATIDQILEKLSFPADF